MKNYILFHDNCMDGWYSGVMAFLKAKYDGNREVVPFAVQYGQDPAVASSGDLVTIVDFSYKADVIDAYVDSGVNVCLIDHHETAIIDLINNSKVVNEVFPSMDHGDIKEDNDIIITNTHDDDFSSFSSLNRIDADPVGKAAFYLSVNKGNKADRKSGALTCLCILRRSESPGFIRNKLVFTLGDSIVKEIHLASSYDLWNHGGELQCDESYLNQYFKSFYEDNKAYFELLKVSKYKSEGFNKAVMTKLITKYFSVSYKDKLAKGKQIINAYGGVAERLANILREVKPVTFLLDEYKDVTVGLIESDNLTSDLTSLAGTVIYSKMGFNAAALINTAKDSDSTIISLRSNGKVNVASVATMHVTKGVAISGGGHASAAGLCVPKGTLVFT